MNEILIIRHYGTKDVDFTGECDTEIRLNGASMFRGDYYHDNAEAFVNGYIQAVKDTNLFYSLREVNINDEPNWD